VDHDITDANPSELAFLISQQKERPRGFVVIHRQYAVRIIRREILCLVPFFDFDPETVKVHVSCLLAFEYLRSDDLLQVQANIQGEQFFAP
jgi:hypothetical protein